MLLFFLSNRLVKEVFDLGVSCLKNSGSPYKLGNISLISKEERKKHFAFITNALKPYMYVQSHSWAGYNGPWIEEVWRDHFIFNSTIDDFGPFVPLFIQWLDIFKLQRKNMTQYHSTLSTIFSYLRTDVLYITVVQNLYGLEGTYELWNNIPPNILILSPTSRGHIPIPHLKEELSPISLKTGVQRKRFVFAGKLGYFKPDRKAILNWFKKEYPNDILIYEGNTSDWIDLYTQGEVVLSPRGVGRGCFRTYEILQLGLIPLIVYNHGNWLPYLNSSLPWDDLALIVSYKNLSKTNLLVPPEKLTSMRRNILKYRKTHFTYQGVMNQIAQFMKNGYERSDLRCDHYYSFI